MNQGKIVYLNLKILFAYFFNAFSIFRCDSLEKLRNRIIQIDNDLTDANKFKDMYQFTFNFAKNPSQKSLDLEDAIAYWKMILSDRFKFLEIWIKFLQVCQFEKFILKVKGMNFFYKVRKNCKHERT